jgi:hypothetical protein
VRPLAGRRAPDADDEADDTLGPLVVDLPELRESVEGTLDGGGLLVGERLESAEGAVATGASTSEPVVHVALSLVCESQQDQPRQAPGSAVVEHVCEYLHHRASPVAR